MDNYRERICQELYSLADQELQHLEKALPKDPAGCFVLFITILFPVWRHDTPKANSRSDSFFTSASGCFE